MKKDYIISEVIQKAWADDISFEKIEQESGLSESDVIKLMRHNLKPGSFRLWRKRVSGRHSKHEKKMSFLSREED